MAGLAATNSSSVPFKLPREFNWRTDNRVYSEAMEFIKLRPFKLKTRLLTFKAITVYKTRKTDEAGKAADEHFLNSPASYEQKLYYCQQRVVLGHINNSLVINNWVFRNAEEDFLKAYVAYRQPHFKEGFEQLSNNPNFTPTVFINVVGIMYTRLIWHEDGLEFIFGQEKDFYTDEVLKIFRKVEMVNFIPKRRLLEHVVDTCTDINLEDVADLPDEWIRKLLYGQFS